MVCYELYYNFIKKVKNFEKSTKDGEFTKNRRHNNQEGIIRGYFFFKKLKKDARLEKSKINKWKLIPRHRIVKHQSIA